MKRHTAAAAIILIASCTAMAHTITPQQALAAAIPQITIAATTNPEHTTPTYTLSRTITHHGTPTIYIMDSDDSSGYLILPAQSDTPPLLGYTTQSNYSHTDTPPAMQQWLTDISNQIALAASHPTATLASQPTATQPISPLIATTWAQGEPFNAQCPVIDGKLCPVGCVATAMAQVLNYWKYPTIGKGSIINAAQNLEYDFTQHPLDFTNLPNNFRNGNYTQAQADAVATLSYACGQAAWMMYTPQASLTSLAYCAEGLTYFLDYAPTMHLATREAYSLADWNQLLYNELLQHRPIIVSGTNADTGHCFLIDGHDGQGHFHLNWGWGGASDGYYLITGLDPETQGIGGSDAGYNINQTVLLGLQPKDPDNPDTMIPAQDMYINCDFGPAEGSYNRRTYYPNFLAQAKPTESLGIRNMSPALTGTYTAIKVTDTQGNSEMLWYSTPISAPNEKFSSKGVSCNAVSSGGFLFIPSDFSTPGTYTITPWTDCNDRLQPIPIHINKRQSVILNVTTSNIQVTHPSTTPATLHQGNLNVHTPIYPGRKVRLSGTVTCAQGEFYNYIHVRLFDTPQQAQAPRNPMRTVRPLDTTDQTTDIALDPIFISVPQGETTPFNWAGTIPDTVTPGTKYMALFDHQGNRISAPIQVTVEQPLTQNAAITLSELSLPQATQGAGLSYQPYIVDGSPLQLTFNLACTQGYFDGTVFCKITSQGQTIRLVTIPQQYITTGNQSHVQMSVALEEADPTKTYEISFLERRISSQGYTTDVPLTGYTYFKFNPETSTITPIISTSATQINYTHKQLKINTETPILKVDLIRPDGTKHTYIGTRTPYMAIDTSHLPHGVYIATVTTTQSTTTHKLIL